MSAVSYPKTVDPVACAAAGRVFEITLPQSHLTRLQDLVVALQGEVCARLAFSKDQQGQVVLEMRLETQVEITCQRCQQPLTQLVKSETTLVPVYNDVAAKNVGSGYEAIIVDDQGELDILNIIEDELILCLPLLPRHKSGPCVEMLSVQIEPEVEAPVVAKPRNPFAVLKGFKEKVN